LGAFDGFLLDGDASVFRGGEGGGETIAGLDYLFFGDVGRGGEEVAGVVGDILGAVLDSISGIGVHIVSRSCSFSAINFTSLTSYWMRTFFILCWNRASVKVSRA
jgi:hypothetical protein